MAKKSGKKQQQTSSSPKTAAAANSLFGKPVVGSFDTQLDSFFKNVAAVPPPTPSATATAVAAATVAFIATEKNKRKSNVIETEANTVVAKRVKGKQTPLSDEDESDKELDLSEGSQLDYDVEEDDDDDDQDERPSQPKDKKTPIDNDDQDDDEDEENATLPIHESLLKSNNNPKKPIKKAHLIKLLEESVNETNQLKDKRTLFLGNLPIQVVQSKSLQKKLRKHIESFSPYPRLTKTTGLRFRSVPFAVPTDDFSAKMLQDQDEGAAKRKERTQTYKEALAAVEGDTIKPREPLNPKQKRKIAFITGQINSNAETVNAYITFAQPKAVYDYLVGKQTKPIDGEQKDGDDDFDGRLTGPILTALIAAVADGQMFQDRHVRVDLVTPLSPSEVLAGGLDKVTTVSGVMAGGAASNSTDPKRTLFVGNLDFQTNEEELRAFFEAIVRQEKGDPEENRVAILGLDGKPPIQPKLIDSSLDDDDEEEEESESENDDDEETRNQTKKTKTKPSLVGISEWVRSVRVVRDKATQMGKGFGYVRFSDSSCIDELLAIHQAEEAMIASAKIGNSVSSTILAVNGGKQIKRRLKFKTRPLRLSRCKSSSFQQSPPSTPIKSRGFRSSGAPTPNGSSPHLSKTNSSFPLPPSPTTIKKNQKQIQEKAKLLGSMEKSLRQVTKKSDADRVQRRLQKKQSKKTQNLVAKEKSKNKEKIKLKQGKKKPPMKKPIKKSIKK